jgi:hypothetical protein
LMKFGKKIPPWLGEWGVFKLKAVKKWCCESTS